MPRYTLNVNTQRLTSMLWTCTACNLVYLFIPHNLWSQPRTTPWGYETLISCIKHSTTQTRRPNWVVFSNRGLSRPCPRRLWCCVLIAGGLSRPAGTHGTYGAPHPPTHRPASSLDWQTQRLRAPGNKIMILQEGPPTVHPYMTNSTCSLCCTPGALWPEETGPIKV